MFASLWKQVRIWVGLVVLAATAWPQTASAYNDSFYIPAGQYFSRSFGCGNCNGQTLTWSTDVPLPAGLSIQPDPGYPGGQFVLIVGAPTEVVSAPITLTGHIQGGGSLSLSLLFDILPPNLALTPASGSLGTVAANGSFSAQITASGGNAPYAYYADTPLPSGLSINPASGAIGGTTNAAPGTYNVNLRATDATTGPGAPYSVSATYQIVILSPIQITDASPLPGATVGVPYSHALTVTGGSGTSQVFELDGGFLQTGLSLSSAGVISGTPTGGGTASIDIRVTDGAGFTTIKTFDLTVNAPTITVDPATLPGGQEGVAYNQTITATGGIAPHHFHITGDVPNGLTLSNGGVLSGTPLEHGSFNVSITATDSATGAGPYSGSRSYTLVIEQPAPTLGTVSPTNGTTAGGTAVTITGTNLTNVSAVTFDGVAAASFTQVNATTLTAVTPAHAAGAVAVAVTTPGGTATLADGYTFVAPGQVRFVVNAEDDGSFVFTSATPGLNFTVTTAGGSGSGPTVDLQPGAYSLAFTKPDGIGLASASCAPAASSVNVGAQTASLSIVSGVSTVCTIETLASRRHTVELIGAALDGSARLILSNGPDAGRRLGRLNGNSGGPGMASAFGKTFAEGLPLSFDVGADRIHFAMSLSGLRALAADNHDFNVRSFAGPLAAPASGGGSLAATAAGTASAGALGAPAASRFDIWVEGTLAGFEAAGNSDGDFVIVHAGADYLVTDDLLIGAGVQGDWLSMDVDSGGLDSSGWLAGPYLTARLDENLYLDLRAAWGRASFDVSPFGTYTDTVDSTRALYTAALIGDFAVGEMTIRPEARLNWYRETVDAYVDSLSVAIPEITVETGEFAVGPSFEWSHTTPGGGLLTPSLGVDLIWTFKQDNTATQFTGAPGLDDTGVRGRATVGLGYVSADGISMAADLFYDGIGEGDYQSWGGRANIAFGF